jgi:hypothetical protein
MEKYDNIQDVFNLTPGNNVNFLGLNWRFLQPDESVSPDILFTTNILCGGRIDADYVAKAYKACEFKIVISCQTDEEYETRPKKGAAMSIMEWSKVPKRKYVHKGLKGVIGIIFAKRYLDGIYISITCANTYVNYMKVVPTKLGLILRTAMLTYASNHLDIKNAYNHAANKDLVKYYRKLGWVLGNQACEVEESVTLVFESIKPEDIDEFLESYDVSLIKTISGYPMKMCNYDIQKVISKTKTDFASVIHNIEELISKYGSICLPKEQLSTALKNVYDETDNTYNESFDIKNYEPPE